MIPHPPGTCLRARRTPHAPTLTVVHYDPRTRTYHLKCADGFVDTVSARTVHLHMRALPLAAHHFSVTLGPATIQQTVHASADLGPQELRDLRRTWAYAQLTGAPTPT